MEQQGRILDGDLETLGLQATLKMLALGGKTGALLVSSGQEHLKITLENGQILALDEPHIPPPDVIEIFFLLDKIDAELARLLHQQSGNNSATALMLMAQSRLISPEDVQRRVEFTVTQSLSRAIRWEHGRFEFHRDTSPIQARAGLYRPLNVDHVLLEALRIADEREGNDGGMALSRYSIPRWVQNAHPSQVELTPDEASVLRLCNGHVPISAMSIGLMIPESQVARMVQRFVDAGLVEIVDARLEQELRRTLTKLHGYSQRQLALSGRVPPEQRMLFLIRTMTECINGLFAHHSQFARALRGRGEVSQVEVQRYIEATFQPVLAHVQREFPRMDEIIRLDAGRLNAEDVETLDRVVKGGELLECYRDGVYLLSEFIQLVFERILTDEVGRGQAGAQYEEIWSAFTHEMDTEATRALGQRTPSLRV
ncbi:MAG TPA: DUF4388 domain-containing protein [Ktedonobacterales bacterium]|jgi:Domain of unknown function (DUF4388)|nr:DUF4388 domain-containing protein [Ktedonobacterales bacterium]